MADVFTRELAPGDLVTWSALRNSLVYGEVLEVRKAGTVVCRMMLGGRPHPTTATIAFEKRLRGGYAGGLRPVTAQERFELHECYVPVGSAGGAR